MPQVHIPPFRVELLYDSAALAETIDWGLAAYHVPEVWRQTKGEGVKVAVLDNGCDLSHPDLVNQIDEHRSFVRGGWDSGDHGTHVAGIIAAAANDRGVVGVVPKARLIVGQVLGHGGGSTEDVTAGVRWAVSRGADIISMSLGGPAPDAELLAAIEHATRRGVFVIAAAGNDGADDSVNYPAKWDSTVAVGSVRKDGTLSAFSSRGEEVDICAPGQDITSCWPGGGYAVLSGTSMATPFVSGVVALVLAKHRKHGGETPLRTTLDLLEHLGRCAVDAGVAGRDPHYGFGLIDPESLIDESGGSGESPKEETGEWLTVFTVGGALRVSVRAGSIFARWLPGK